ncbi:Ribokinase-like protein [Aspergillus pseudotamarii]|uniref:Ribokinase n=1 Tax=Aspergillus pseudotamarii TaxID=132259 RepID=A0A5N6SL27_ASPPS|nr:Ribokinase-like protein [Aspergillus pseudotamarii]KAE8135245.1 Ribokinase-like protein [Aspergillus pseudotamarii]
MAPTIRVVGSLNADMVSVTPRFPEAGETITSSSYFISAGGKGANQAVACGRLSRARSASSTFSGKDSVKVEMVGAVGGLDGHFDALLKPTLEKSGVDTSRVKIVEDAYTGVAVIIVDSSAGGENRILFSPGANYQGMQPEPSVLGMAMAAPVPDVIVMQGEIPVESVIGILRDIGAWKAKNRAEGKRGIEAGPDVMFNPAPAPPGGLPEDVYAAVDHFIMNETEAELMTPPAEQLLKVVPNAEGLSGNDKVARYFHQLGVTYVLITLGSKGVWYSATDARTSGPADGVNRFTNEIPAAKVSRVLDTTAAGDTFVGAYAVGVARWREQRRADGKAGQDLTSEEKPVRYQKVMDDAMGLATQASARCVERQGAMDSIPWEDEI